MLKVAVPTVSDSLTQAVLSYQEIKAKIAFLENELKAPKEVIEAAAAQTSDGKIVTENFSVTLSIVERENFSLKAAKAVFGDELNPFITVSKFTSLRVK